MQADVILKEPLHGCPLSASQGGKRRGGRGRSPPSYAPGWECMSARLDRYISFTIMKIEVFTLECRLSNRECIFFFEVKGSRQL